MTHSGVRSIETGSRWWVMGSGRGGVVFNGDKVSVWEDGKFKRRWSWLHHSVTVLRPEPSPPRCEGAKNR